MGEIKFRAWNYDTEKHIYQGEMESIFACCSIIQVLKAIRAKIGYDIKIIDSFNGKLEQYTEAKDRTKKEIYQNDILESGTSKHKYVVVKENGAWVGRSLTSGMFVLPYSQFCLSKVIGTIHDYEGDEK